MNKQHKLIEEIIFFEFNIQESDVVSCEKSNNTNTYQILDEENTRAVLTINFDNNKYKIELDDGYIEEKELIIL